MNTKTSSRLALLLLFSVFAMPATRTQVKEKAKARESFVSEKEQTSKDTNKDWSQNEPARDAEEWYDRGFRLHSSDRYPEAIEAFKHAIDLGYRKGAAMYNIACGYSLLNDKENAFVWLQRALDNGFDGNRYLAHDSDLDPLRSDPRFKKIMANLPEVDGREYIRNAKNRYSVDRLEQANLDFTRLERESSRDGEEWAKVGARLLLLRDLDRSVVSLNRAATYLDYRGSSAMYNLACAYALKGDRDNGIEWLEKAVNHGFDSSEKLRNDPDISSLRSDSRFARIDNLSNTLSLSQFKADRESFNDSDSYNYSKERWAPAIVLYESFVKSEPNNGRAWFNLGYALHYSREHAKAIEAFNRALALGYHKPVSSYNIACAYAMLNQKDEAFEWLDRALKEGFEFEGNLTWDKDLDNLRSDPRFQRYKDNFSFKHKPRTEIVNW
jgi:tetratricopeptide (TPR) repeat protein